MGGTVVKVGRRSTDDIRRAAEEGSLLVVGEPGAGKSGALHDLVEALGQRGRDVVFLAVDRLAAHSLGELREELGLSRELADVLVNWPGPGAGFLVVDALDGLGRVVAPEGHHRGRSRCSRIKLAASSARPFVPARSR